MVFHSLSNKMCPDCVNHYVFLFTLSFFLSLSLLFVFSFFLVGEGQQAHPSGFCCDGALPTSVSLYFPSCTKQRISRKNKFSSLFEIKTFPDEFCSIPNSATCLNARIFKTKKNCISCWNKEKKRKRIERSIAQKTHTQCSKCSSGRQRSTLIRFLL